MTEINKLIDLYIKYYGVYFKKYSNLADGVDHSLAWVIVLEDVVLLFELNLLFPIYILT